jgi:hypothetical protein
MSMRKKEFRLRAALEQDGRHYVVLTYNLQDIQPWKQRAPLYQTAVYRADAAGLASGSALADPVEYRTEEQARQGHTATVSSLRGGTLPLSPRPELRRAG